MTTYATRQEAIDAARQIKCPRCGSGPAEPIGVQEITFSASGHAPLYIAGLVECPNAMDHYRKENP